MTISPPGSVDPPDLSDLGAEPPATRTPPDPPGPDRSGGHLLSSSWACGSSSTCGGRRSPRPTSCPARAFALKAEPICKLTATQLAALPPAQASPDNVARAAVVSQTNQDLRAMLARLATVVPSGNDGRIVREWLADYSTYVGNREDYARRLRTDPKARFYEAQKNPGEQISDPIDTLATANHMDDCVAPEDLS